ncbi:unnamed protein product [Brassicogethes aeneus]|uniref:BHLH domain-containing protein n=1 Tax=Brassicogethes aeneus TaxID=1431903 RepID=A0A9P0BER6_BRAAE|nr:unnamed protein product [Brassicogethes aeneus]
MLEYADELSHRLGFTDSNNNAGKKGDKYSLRPRSMRRNKNFDDDSEEISATKVTTKARGKTKQKAPPLSKYRRKTANARERSRMREINQAFETLRKVVPQMQITHQQQNEKLTKITTLRLAMKYISTLSAALTSSSSSETTSQDFFSDCSELDCFLLESDGESLPLHSDFSDHSLTPADFTIDFPEDSLTPVDFSPLSPTLSDHLHFDPFLGDFS